MRYQVAKNIEFLYKHQGNLHKKYHNGLAHNESKIPKQIKDKLSQHNAIIAKGDKGNTINIINKIDYHNKTKEFINTNKSTPIHHNSTNIFQKNHTKPSINITYLFLKNVNGNTQT
jgi:hypothetical protein